ncbi:MAG: tetratricopeptide repeat protein [Spirochaetes bacterium]|nr:tetratricopeptide repeat protein [Spirochaetota bacterium]MBN2769380.1 tetratricopeptide repeat protein [Spirochaetota bacterium]
MCSNTEEFLKQNLSYYKSIGFYNNYDNKNIDKLVEDFKNFGVDLYYGIPKEDDDNIRQLFGFLGFDNERTWFIEDIATLYLENDFKDDLYGATLKKLSSISGGAFLPENIRVEETGYLDNGCTKLILKFCLSAQEHELIMAVDGNILNLGFTQELNDLLSDLDRSFVLFEDDYSSTIVLFITKKQKQTLENEKKIKFLKYPSYWYDKANLFMDQEKYEDAKMAFERALSIKDKYSPLHSDYACLLEKLGKNKEALEQHKLAMENSDHDLYKKIYEERKVSLNRE